MVDALPAREDEPLFALCQEWRVAWDAANRLNADCKRVMAEIGAGSNEMDAELEIVEIACGEAEMVPRAVLGTPARSIQGIIAMLSVVEDWSGGYDDADFCVVAFAHISR